jgi:hypothetical protein
MKKSCRTFWEFNRYNVGISKDLKFLKKSAGAPAADTISFTIGPFVPRQYNHWPCVGLRVCLPSVSDVVVALDRLTVRSSARDESLQTAAR